MGYIADLSRYDPLTAVDGYDGVILNVEDPGFTAKRDRAIANGTPWGTYSWVYPGQGAAAAQRAFDAGTGPLGAWMDYEQDGVTPADISAAKDRADQLGLRMGVYTYLYILTDAVKVAIGDSPLWLAYYPGQNDGTYRSNYSDDARAHGAVLHQFTSSGGTRDLNVVLDPARWPIGSPTPAPPAPIPHQEDMDMYILPDPAHPDDKYLVGETGARHIKSIDEYNWLRSGPPYGGQVKEIPLKLATQAWFDDLPKIATP